MKDVANWEAMPEESRFKACLKRLLGFEGGWVNHPSDPGGATNYGITHATYSHWRKQNHLKPRSVKHITRNEVEAIYKQNYWNKSKAGAYKTAREAYFAFDSSVLWGVGKVRKWRKACDDNFWCQKAKRAESHLKNRLLVFHVGWGNRTAEL